MNQPWRPLHPSLGIARVMVFVLLLASSGAATWAQEADGRDEIIQRMIRLVLDSNATLASQQELLRESELLPTVRSGIALSALNFNFATSVWDLDAGTFRLVPAVTLGTSLSIGDPSRALNGFNLKKEREAARQGYQKTRNTLVTDLLVTVRELIKLRGRRESLQKLRSYLQDYSDLIEKQVRAGVSTPELDKLWELKERLLGIEAEIGDVENQLATMRLEASLRLAGDSWRELQEIFASLGG